MKKRLFYIITSLLLVPMLMMAQVKEKAVDPRAKALIDKAVATFRTDKIVSAHFSVNLNNAKNGKNDSFDGMITLKGDKFKLSLRDMETYYNGKIQSVVMTKEKEVTISEPMSDDLKEVNPIMMIKSAKSDFKMRYIEEKSSATSHLEVIELYPNDLKSNYSILTLYLDKNNYQPKKLILKGKDGIMTTFTINKIEVLKNVDEKMFTFNILPNSGYEVVDLR